MEYNLKNIFLHWLVAVILVPIIQGSNKFPAGKRLERDGKSEQYRHKHPYTPAIR